MRTLARTAALSLAVLALVLSSLAVGLPAMRGAPGLPPSPVSAGETTNPLVPSSSHPAILASRSPATYGASGVAPAAGTPAPHWSDRNFFNDVKVTFSVPGQAKPANIQPVPYRSTVSMYATGFYVNISTDVPITRAFVNIWATQYPTGNGIPPQAVVGFDPANAKSAGPLMQIGSDPRTASYYFDIVKYFWPGSNVSFNIEVQSVNATPTSIWSNASINVTQPFPDGYTNYPTWIVVVESPWASPIFSNDIQVSTIPSVLSQPVFDPNPNQKLQVTIRSFNQSGGPATPIPIATLVYSVTTCSKSGCSTSSASARFTPLNSTLMSLENPIGPFPQSTVTFNITVGLPWAGGTGQIDTILSKDFTFNWSTHGGWPQPTSPLESNANLSTTPNVLGPTTAHLPTGTRVNVSVREAVQNVTIGSGEVDYEFSDHGATFRGSLPMALVNPNTSYATIPGLPQDASVTFSVIMKDIFGNAVSSGNHTYVENGTPTLAIPAGQTYFYVEAYDVAVGSLVASANFSISNATWSQNGTTAPMGFGVLYAYGSTQPVLLNFGTYFLTMNVFGSSSLRQFTLSSASPTTVVFYVASSPVSVQTSSPAPASFEYAAFVGLVASTLTAWPIWTWFKERRAKAEEEQRRVTL